jgi:hypothetical protein
LTMIINRIAVPLISITTLDMACLFVERQGLVCPATADI